MNTKMNITMAVAALVAAGTIGFAPANEQRAEVLVIAHEPVQVMTSPETPQDQVWDMTYGLEQPVAVVEETVAAVEQDIVDYSLG
jgi:hypothetical protein